MGTWADELAGGRRRWKRAAAVCRGSGQRMVAAAAGPDVRQQAAATRRRGGLRAAAWVLTSLRCEEVAMPRLYHDTRSMKKCRYNFDYVSRSETMMQGL